MRRRLACGRMEEDRTPRPGAEGGWQAAEEELGMEPHQVTVNPAHWPIADGMRVYGIDGEQLGTVRNYDPQDGYLDVQRGWLLTKDLYVPFRAVATITGDGITLRLTKEDLDDDRYLTPPATDGVMEGENYVVRETMISDDAGPTRVEREDVTVMRTG